MQVHKLLGLAILAATLYYIYYLERDYCKCIRDWRHDYIKYYTWILILLPVIMALLGLVLLGLRGIGFIKYLIPVLVGFLLVSGSVNLYAMYTYIGDLNTTSCACAITDLKYINTFLYYWRYVMVVSYAIAIVLILLNAGNVINLVNGGNHGKKDKN